MDNKITIFNTGTGLTITTESHNSGTVSNHDLSYCDIKSSAIQGHLVLRSNEAALPSDYPGTSSKIGSITHNFSGLTTVEQISEKIEELCAQSSGGGGGDVPADIYLTYQELYDLRTAGDLVAGQAYVIEYTNDHYVENSGGVKSISTGLTIPTEQLRIIATSEDQTEFEAHSLLHPKDIINYTLDSTWWGDLESPTAKGAITFRHTPVDDAAMQDVAMPQDCRYTVHIRGEVDLTSTTGKATANYLAPVDGYQIGMEYGTSGSKETLNWTAPSNFQYSFSFLTGLPGGTGNVTYARNVHLKAKIWSSGATEGGNPIINIVASNIFRDVHFDSCDLVTCEQIMYHWRAEYVKNCVLADTNTIYNASNFREAQGTLDSVFVSIGNAPLKDCENISVHYDKTAAVQVPTCDALSYIRDSNFLSIKIYSSQAGKACALQWENNERVSAVLETHSSKFISVVKGMRPVQLWNGGNFWIDTTDQYDEANNRKITYTEDYSSIQTQIDVTAAGSILPLAGLDVVAGKIYLVKTAGDLDHIIDSVSGSYDNHKYFTKELIPQTTGLTITIPTNNVAGGFVSGQQSAAQEFGQSLFIRKTNTQWAAFGGDTGGLKVKTITASYTVKQSDLDYLIRVDTATTGTVVVTYPDTLSKGFANSVQLVGTGDFSISATAIQSVSSYVKIATQNGAATVFHVDGAGTYSASGELEA